MKHLKLWPTLFLILFLIEVFSVLPLTTDFSQTTVPTRPFARGVVHLSPLSSSNLDISFSPLVRAAKKNRYQFLILQPGEGELLQQEGIHQGVTVFFEKEVELPAGHTTTLSLPTPIKIMAHPNHVRYPWKKMEIFEEGLEVFSLSSALERQAYDNFPRLFLSLLLSPFNQFLVTVRSLEVFEKDLGLWDQVNAFSVGHFGVVSHDIKKLPFSQTIARTFPWIWEKILHTTSNIVLLKESLPDDFLGIRDKLSRGISEGNMVVAFEAIHPFEGNDWRLQCVEQHFISGDKPNLDGKSCEFQLDLPLTLPYPAFVRLIRNGTILEDTLIQGNQWRRTLAEPGVYRVEVLVEIKSRFGLLAKSRTPYLFYNPIYVR